MTGQFTLAALEEEEYPVNYRRVSDLDQGVSIAACTQFTCNGLRVCHHLLMYVPVYDA